MQFHLNHTPTPSVYTLTHQHPIVSLGSCFAQNIGAYLQAHHFSCELNPFGILFNPISIANALTASLNGSWPTTAQFVQHKGLWFSYDYHSDVYATSAEALAEKINHIHTHLRHKLLNASVLFITFGSAHAYQHLPSQCTVANCHKQAPSLFHKILLSVETIYTTWQTVLEALKAKNPNLQIIFSVSPVKYLKDGLHENNLSKSVLLLSTHQLIHTEKQTAYFPAFELVTDDLRDYRFYKADLAHPNEQAIQYVWDKFSTTFFDAQTLQLNKELERIHQGMAHRPLHRQSEEYHLFKESYLKKCLLLQQTHPFLNLAPEIAYFDHSKD